MKKMQIAIGACAVALLLTLSACKKNDTAATCGSGLLCTNVDGVSYTAKPYSSSSSFFTGTAYNGSYAQLVPSSTSTGGYYMNVSGNNGDANNNPTWEVDFRITQLPVAGSTYTTQAGSASFDYYAGSSSNQLHYVTDASHTGTVTITSIDTTNNLVSGSFSYTATEPSGQNYTPTQHSITSGTFTNLLIKR